MNRSRRTFDGKPLTEASEFIKVVLQLCEQIQGREGMPPRSKAYHVCTVLSECFLDALPPATNLIYKKTESFQAQRAALELVNRAICAYTAACFSLPPEVDAIGMNCTTIFVMYTIFE